MNIWQKFAEGLKSPKLGIDPRFSAIDQLMPFCFDNYDEILDNIKDRAGLKFRVSMHSSMSDDELDDLTRRLFVLSDLIVFSPGLVKTCALLFDTRLDDIAGLGGCFEACGFTFPPFGRDMLQNFSFLRWLDAWSPLFSTGELAFLPIRGSLASWEYPKLGLLSESLHYSKSKERFDDSLKWMRRTIAKDMTASDLLGCSHVLPRGFSIPTVVSRIKQDARAVALLSLKVPTFDRIQPTDLFRIKEEERDSFRNFQSSITAALAEMPEHVEDPSELKSSITKIQKDLIDVPSARLVRRIRRLERYGYYRSLGYTIGATTIFLTGVFGGHPLSELAGGLVGSVSLLKAYENFLSVLQGREELLEDSGAAYLGRLRLGPRGSRRPKVKRLHEKDAES